MFGASNPQFWTRVCTFHRSDTLQDLTTHKGSLILPVHLSTRLLVARKSIESKKKKGSAHDFPKMEALWIGWHELGMKVQPQKQIHTEMVTCQQNSFITSDQISMLNDMQLCPQIPYLWTSDKPVVEITSNPLFWDKDWLIFGPSNSRFLDKKWCELPGASRHLHMSRVLETNFSFWCLYVGEGILGMDVNCLHSCKWNERWMERKDFYPHSMLWYHDTVDTCSPLSLSFLHIIYSLLYYLQYTVAFRSIQQAPWHVTGLSKFWFWQPLESIVTSAFFSTRSLRGISLVSSVTAAAPALSTRI